MRTRHAGSGLASMIPRAAESEIKRVLKRSPCLSGTPACRAKAYYPTSEGQSREGVKAESPGQGAFQAITNIKKSLRSNSTESQYIPHTGRIQPFAGTFSTYFSTVAPKRTMGSGDVVRLRNPLGDDDLRNAPRRLTPWCVLRYQGIRGKSVRYSAPSSVMSMTSSTRKPSPREATGSSECPRVRVI